ncbi:hypothetical protein [Kitasatospora herbaricolor]|uniref:MFS transporter n=1 Tax=Kitasatospora herbaricolor TaxID=68217 RepID=A0ABZ1WMK1_9ACTN|nr:hypothetical protein [Kitasatospora herbaricolor]
MTDLQTRPAAPGGPARPPARATRPGLLLALVLSGQFMAVLDIWAPATGTTGCSGPAWRPSPPPRWPAGWRPAPAG